LNFRFNSLLAGSAALATDKPNVILFTEKKTSPPMFRSLSLQFKSSLAFGEVHSSEKELVARFGIETFPSILVVSGDRVEKYEGPLKANDIRKFLKQFGESDWSDWGSAAAAGKDTKSKKAEKPKEEKSFLRTISADKIAAEFAQIGERPLVVAFAAASDPSLKSLEKVSSQLQGVSMFARVEPGKDILAKFGLNDAPALARFTKDSANKPAVYGGALSDETALYEFSVGELENRVQELSVGMLPLL